jgi:branched-chain amino acid transport system ATP-binding protein
LLKLSNVTIKFGGLTAVNNLDLEVEKSSIFGLIGPNGAGKTTAFNIISGVYKPTDGQITFKDKRIEGLEQYKITNLGIARTYQNLNLFKTMTVLENVMVGRHTRSQAGLFSSIAGTPAQAKEEKEIHEKSIEILDFMGLANIADSIASSLSYGEQKKLEICRALASEPELLLLDEPAAGMNMKEKGNLKELIQKINEMGITILIVEHDMKLVMGICHSICVLNYGKRIACGEPGHIQKNPGVIEAYLGGGHRNG